MASNLHGEEKEGMAQSNQLKRKQPFQGVRVPGAGQRHQQPLLLDLHWKQRGKWILYLFN